MATARHFSKPVLTVKEQIDLLTERGLVIANPQQAEHYLTHIGYYRFSGYMHPFKASNDTFIEGASFDQILDLYIFDRKLRVLTFDAIERIEVACRSVITASMSERHGAFWFNKAKLFVTHKGKLTIDGYRQTQDMIRKETLNREPRKRDTFIRHYYEQYDKPDLPPSWMVFETLSMGAVSKILNLLTVEGRKHIADRLGLKEKHLVSWIWALTYTRNLCAHHSRLWNRTFTIKLAADKTRAICRDRSFSQAKYYAQAVVIGILLDIISPDSHWEQRLKQLFDEHPNINPQEMGFPEGWDGFNLQA